MPIENAYQDNHVSFEIANIEWDEDYDPTFSGDIEFEYKSPAISVDTSGRFKTHEIIGGTTVRQKIGDDPIEVSVNGVCKESTAKKLDELRNASYGVILTNRLPNDFLRVQFASTSTSPMDDAGAVAISDQQSEFLYNFTLSAVEVEVL
jgi:hypothetical protein